MRSRVLASTIALASCLTIGASGIADAGLGAPVKKPPCEKAPGKIGVLRQRAADLAAQATKLEAKSAEKLAAGHKAAARALAKSAGRAHNRAAELTDRADALATECSL